MNVFLINLDKNTDRLVSADEQLHRLGVSYERFSAINGKALSDVERKRLSSSFRSWLCLAHVIKGGELGCALSHMAVYRLMVERQLPYALVLEDDVILSDRFPDVLQMAEQYVNSNLPQVILFSDWGGEGGSSYENGLQELQSAGCADAYLITLSAAKLILRVNQPVICVADAWGRWVRRHGLKLYRAYPTTARQANERFESALADWSKRSPTELLGTDGTGRSGLNWFFFKVVRALSKGLDCLLFLITGR